MSQKREHRYRQLAERQDKLENDMRELQARQVVGDRFVQSLELMDQNYRRRADADLLDAKHTARVERRNAEMFKRLAIGALVTAVVIEVLAIAAICVNKPTEAPKAETTAQQVTSKLPMDEPAATESAVWTGPVPEIVTLEDVTVTHYCPCEKCCGEWADGTTATGTKATEGRTIAVDPAVIPYGSEVCLRFEDGTEAVYIAEDCGGAIKGNRVDVYMDSHDAALAAGIRTATAVFEAKE